MAWLHTQCLEVAWGSLPLCKQLQEFRNRVPVLSRERLMFPLHCLCQTDWRLAGCWRWRGGGGRTDGGLCQVRRRRRSGGGSSFALFYSSASFLLFFFKQIENPRYLREKPIPLSPVSVKALPSAPHELRKMMKRRMRKRREQESVCLIFTLSLSLPCSPPLCTMCLCF